MPDLNELAAVIRDAPGLRAKRELALVASALPSIDGDDAALIRHGDDHLVLAGEAILPSLVERDPFGAGAAAVATNVADVRAMGGRPLGLVDTLVSPDREHARRVLDGLAWAASRLGVDIVGGHLTLGAPPALAAFCTGVARTPLRAAGARAGDALVAAFCLDGEYRGAAPLFSSLRAREPDRLRDDGEALVEVAERGLCRAARDVSMPGAAGSLLQMLELAGCGATLDLDLLPRPPATPLERWLVTFPSFGFVLAAPPDRAEEACERFTSRGLAAAVCGGFDATGVLRIASGGAMADVWDLARDPLTGLNG
ncbi:MAG TPA: AIR synthase related protein [Baekduia sp.]|uniref:AIR synthase related protein n=1 Tax=Baekduia sp. TaxID=2600305 RepID=UPI002B7F3AA9|nr:AIR synthase related protein [Baekduia sp.]HMJ37312.1 AIR synthase related protein [Baekduia sp.]